MTSFESTMPVVGAHGLGIIETMMGFPDPDPRRLYEFFVETFVIKRVRTRCFQLSTSLSTMCLVP